MNSSVVHAAHMSLPITHKCKRTNYIAERNKHKCSVVCAAKTRGQTLHGGFFDILKAWTATEPSICLRLWSSSTANFCRKQMSFSFFSSPCLFLLQFETHEKKKKPKTTQRPVTAALSVYGFQHPGYQSVHGCSSSVLLFSCVFIDHDSWC